MERLNPALPALARPHGGPDARGAARFDFSTNSNACGPCPMALQALQQADASRYPDATYSRLRLQLATFHGVAPQRVALAGSASEFIFRITAWAARSGLRRVQLPRHGYGDYRAAAEAWGLGEAATGPALGWACDPSSPLGQVPDDLAVWAGADGVRVLDRAYEPLRLQGQGGLDAAGLQRVWQLFSPNKALGLTGVRAAYAIAPQGAQQQVDDLAALCPSWPLGAHGVALLESWCQVATQDWLAASRERLRGWKVEQLALLEQLGWQTRSSVANFVLTAPAPAWLRPAAQLELRARGIQWRDAASFGLPGWVRLAVLPPAAQQALAQAVTAQDSALKKGNP